MITIYRNDNIDVLVDYETYGKIEGIINEIYYVYKSRSDINNIDDFFYTLYDVIEYNESEDTKKQLLEELDILKEFYYIN